MPEPSMLLAIAVMALVTLATRLGGPFLARVAPPGPRTERALAAASHAVLAALVASFLAAGGAREAAAVAAAAIVSLSGRGPGPAMIAGMAVAALWTALA